MNITVSSLVETKSCDKQCATCRCGPKPSDKWIPWYFVLFFAVVIGALGFFTYLALKTEPGVVTSDAYQKGLNYDRIIAAANEAQQLPWQIDVSTVSLAKSTRLQIKFENGGGADIEAWWIRAAQNGADRHWVLQPKGNGIYEASGKLPMKGAWDLRVTVEKDGKQKQFLKQVVIE